MDSRSAHAVCFESVQHIPIFTSCVFVLCMLSLPCKLTIPRAFTAYQEWELKQLFKSPRSQQDFINKVLKEGQAEGRDGGREGGREGGRQAGRQAGREGGREAGRQAGRVAGREGGREGGREKDSESTRLSLRVCHGARRRL